MVRRVQTRHRISLRLMLARSLMMTRLKPFDDSINRFEGRQGLKSQVEPLADGLYGVLPMLTRHLCPSHSPMVLPTLIQEKRLCAYEVELLGSIRGSVLSNSHCLQMERQESSPLSSFVARECGSHSLRSFDTTGELLSHFKRMLGVMKR